MCLHKGLPINSTDDRLWLNHLHFSTQAFIMDITWWTIWQWTCFFLCRTISWFKKWQWRCHVSNTDLMLFDMFFISLSMFTKISFTVNNVYITIQAIGNTRLVNLHNTIQQKVFVFTQITFLWPIPVLLVFYSNIKCFRITNFWTPFNYIISYGIKRHTFIFPCTSLNFFFSFILLYLKIKFY